MKTPPPDMKVRLSAELRTKVEEAAQRNNRTLNAEITSRLEWSFADDHTPFRGVAPRGAEDQSIRAEVEKLRDQLQHVLTRLDRLDGLTKDWTPFGLSQRERLR